MNTTREVCYRKGLVAQVELYDKPCKIFQQFNNRKTLHGYVPPKIIAELKTWVLVHIYLIGSYSKSIIKQNPGSAIIKKYGSLVCMTIKPDMCWFEIVEITMFNIDEVTYQCIHHLHASPH